MNIVIISAVFPPEPVVSAKLSEDLALELSKEHTVTVLCPKPTRPFGFDFPENEKVIEGYQRIVLESYTCPESRVFGRLKESYSFGKACHAYIESHHKAIDCIYMNTWPIFGQNFVKKAASKFKVPYIVHIQDVYPESLANKVPVVGGILSSIFRPLDASILQKASKIVAISEKMKNYLHQTRKVPLSKISVVLNWQDEAPFLDVEALENDDDKSFTFMYLGNIGPVAGCDLLIRAFAESNLKSSRLVIAGSGSKRESLKSLVKDLKLETIEFWDVPDGQVPATQAKADVMLLPIKKGAASSSIPSKLPAYMFSGNPILASVDSDSDTARAIIDSECGWVVEPENVSALKAKMIEVHSTIKETLQKKGKAGQAYSLDNFSKRVNLNKLVKTILSIDNDIV